MPSCLANEGPLEVAFSLWQKTDIFIHHIDQFLSPNSRSRVSVDVNNYNKIAGKYIFNLLTYLPTYFVFLTLYFISVSYFIFTLLKLDVRLLREKHVKSKLNVRN